MPKFDLHKVRVDAKPLYAGAGVAELAVEALKEYAARVQHKVEDYQKDATERFAHARKTVSAIEPKTLQANAKDKLGATASTATVTYEDLAKRGEEFVAKLRGKPSVEPVAPTEAPSDSKADTDTSAANNGTADTSTAKTAPAKKSTTARKTAQPKKSD